MKETNTYEVNTKFNKDLIIQETGFSGSDRNSDMARNVIQLQEQGVREALIKLGWTPPESLADIRAEAVMSIIKSDLGFSHTVNDFESEWVYSEDDIKDHANKIKGAE